MTKTVEFDVAQATLGELIEVGGDLRRSSAACPRVDEREVDHHRRR